MPRTLGDAPLRRDIVAHRLGIELPSCLASDRTPWHTVVCSHLGRNLIKHQPHTAMVFQWIEHAIRQGERSLIVRNTAAARWANRACCLLGHEPVRLVAGAAKPPWLPVAVGAGVCRDRLAIELADRVDATFVRPSGTIMRLLCERLEGNANPAIQVLVSQASDQAAKRLISRGAIGYWINPGSPLPATPESLIAGPSIAHLPAAESLVQNPERWLVHSTRARSGPWPGESMQQFIDGLLLQSPTNAAPSPLETLVRIVHDRRLVGTHRTTLSSQNVICFSSLPLRDWLARRSFRPHLGRWDAEPYGVAIHRAAAMRCGVLPVIYDDHPRQSALGAEQAWRRQAIGSTFDWKGEREWRGRGVLDLSRFAHDEVVVFVKHAHDRAALAASPWAVVDIDSLFPPAVP